MAAYIDGYWWSGEGLRLHYRDYPAEEAFESRPPILCLPGLTRNARDFANLADRLAGQWRLICPEMRGRAESAHAKDAMTYVPLTYLQDIERLLADLALKRFVAIGTSLGGLLTMLLATTGSDRLAGALLNDIGPDIEKEGLDRIRNNVGSGSSHPTWIHAARALGDNNRALYPDYALDDWLAMAKRLYRLNRSGRIVQDYDARIAEPLRIPGNEAGVDLWPTMQAFHQVPTLIVRGELSDLFSEKTAKRMLKDIGKSAQLLTVKRVGHAPTLDEPEAVVAIDSLLQNVLANG
jgi:pimeloyl-ACP methyl ester carboxylesterase